MRLGSTASDDIIKRQQIWLREVNASQTVDPLPSTRSPAPFRLRDQLSQERGVEPRERPEQTAQPIKLHVARN